MRTPGNVQKAARRLKARSAADHITAYLGRPLLGVGESKIVGGLMSPLLVDVSLSDNAAISEDLRPGNKWDVRVQQAISSGSQNLRAVLHLEAMSLYVHGSTFHTEAAALKSALDDALYIEMNAGNVTEKFPLCGRIHEPWGNWQYVAALASGATTAESRVQFGRERPYLFERPRRIDLESDTFKLVLDAADAVNWSGGAISAKLKLYGFLIPKGVDGADGITHTNLPEGQYDVDVGGAQTHVPPDVYEALHQRFLANFALMFPQ